MPPLKVLIPLDGSALSRAIIPHITRLLQPSEATFVLLRAIDPPQGMVSPPPRLLSTAWPVPMYEAQRDVELAKHPIYASQVWESVCAAVKDELVSAARELQVAGFSISVAVCAGDPVETIVGFVETEGIDLVAMATHGHTGLRRLVLGSVADGVLHQLRVPVLLIRPFNYPDDEEGIEYEAAKVEA